MTTLNEQFHRAIGALAFAGLGERVGRREKHAALFPGGLSPRPVSPPGAASRWIALDVGETLSAPVLAYVIGACRRMQAGLLLLSVDALHVRELLAEHLAELRGIECRTEELSNASSTAVLRALNLHRGVLFAVTGAEDSLLRPLLRKRLAPVPIVMVSARQ